MSDLSTRSARPDELDPIDKMLGAVGEFFNDPYNKTTGSTIKKFLVEKGFTSYEACRAIYDYLTENFSRRFRTSPGVVEYREASASIIEHRTLEKVQNVPLLTIQKDPRAEEYMRLLNKCFAEGRNPKTDPDIMRIMKGVEDESL